jgi:hypothetical protein
VAGLKLNVARDVSSDDRGTVCGELVAFMFDDADLNLTLTN